MTDQTDNILRGILAELRTQIYVNSVAQAARMIHASEPVPTDTDQGPVSCFQEPGTVYPFGRQP